MKYLSKNLHFKKSNRYKYLNSIWKDFSYDEINCTCIICSKTQRLCRYLWHGKEWVQGVHNLPGGGQHRCPNLLWYGGRWRRLDGKIKLCEYIRYIENIVQLTISGHVKLWCLGLQKSLDEIFNVDSKCQENGQKLLLFRWLIDCFGVLCHIDSI